MLKAISLGVASLALISCGGGNDSSSNASGQSVSTVSGFVSKGPINGAICSLFNAANQQVATATTIAGVIDFGNISSAGAYSASCSGGTYVDEATGKVVNNTTVLRSGMVVGAGGSSKLTVSPLTEMAFQAAGGDPNKITASAKIIAKAFGLPTTLDILTTRPTDVNTTAAGSDDAGQYGILLASIAQFQKDQGMNLSTAITTMSNAVATSSTGEVSLSAGVASLLSASTANLIDPAKNENSAVQSNVSKAVAQVTASLAAVSDSSAFVNSMSLRKAGLPVDNPKFGEIYTFVATGGNLTNVTIAPSNMICATPTVTAQTMSADCTMGSSNATASFAVQAGVVPVKGLTPSMTVYLGNGTKSCRDSTIVTEVTPKSFTYAAPAVPVSIKGCNLATGALLTLAGQSCSSATGSAAGQLQYSCNVTNNRIETNTSALVLSNFGDAAPNSTNVTFVAPNVNVTAVVPSQLVQGGKGSTNTIVSGTGLYANMPITLGGAACTGGQANATGTQISGLNCSGATFGTNQSVTSLQVMGSALNISLIPAPAPLISVGGSSTVQMGTSLALAPNSNSSGSFTFTVQSGGSNVSVSPSGEVSGVAVGSASILINQAAVVGEYAAGSSMVEINVSAQTLPTVSFAEANKTITLGSADFTNAATASCSSATGTYNPVITYSVSAGSTLISVNAVNGTVGLKAAGTATIVANVSALGGCAAQSVSYQLTINKATPVVSFASSSVNTVFGQVVPGNLASVSKPANLGSHPLPSVAGLSLSYSSATPTVASVDSLGAVTVITSGTSEISASSAADANYNSANALAYVLTVAKATPTLSFAATGTLGVQTRSAASPSPVTVAGPLGETPPSGGVVYAIDNTSVATVNATGAVLGVTPGNATLTADFPGDANYTAATLTLPLTVTVGPCPSITAREANDVAGTFTYTGLPGADAAALRAFDFCGGSKVLVWNPRIADGPLENPNEIQLLNFGIDDRIVIDDKSGANPDAGKFCGVCSSITSINSTWWNGSGTGQLYSYQIHEWTKKKITNAPYPIDKYRWQHNSPLVSDKGAFIIHSSWEGPLIIDGVNMGNIVQQSYTKLMGFPSYAQLFGSQFQQADGEGYKYWNLYDTNLMTPSTAIVGQFRAFIAADSFITFRP